MHLLDQEFDAAVAVLNSGAEYASLQKSEYSRILFMLSSGMVSFMYFITFFFLLESVKISSFAQGLICSVSPGLTQEKKRAGQFLYSALSVLVNIDARSAPTRDAQS